MRTILQILFFILLLIWTSEPVITLNPFSIKFKSLLVAIGLLGFFIGIICFSYNSHSKGYKKGYTDAQKEVIELLDNNQKLQP